MDIEPSSAQHDNGHRRRIPAPRPAPRRTPNQMASVSGERNHLWKGDGAGYGSLHAYLSRHFPKRSICDSCGKQAPTEYALIHGRTYSRNRDDYLELCRRCHSRYDTGGERNYMAKLTAEDVAEIRRRYVPSRGGGGRRQPNSSPALAREFGVTPQTIRAILAGRKWASTR